MSFTKQISLFEEHKGVIEIKKHSALVAMSNVTSTQQRRLINPLLRIAKDQLKRNPDSRVFSVEVGLLKRLSGIARNDNSELKENLKNFVKLVIEYNILGKDKEIWGAFPFLSWVQILGDRRGKTATLKFELATPILEAVKNPKMYVRLNLLIQRGLTWKYGYALYEILKDYQNLWKRLIEIDSFRRLMGIKEGQYKVFTMLKKRVLDVAVNDINEKTDLSVSYELERHGRKIESIRFSVTGTSKKPTLEEIYGEITERLRSFGLKDSQIKKVLEHHDQDYILANIAVVEESLGKGKKIKNIPAYLLKAFEVDFRPIETEFEKNQKQKQALLLQETEVKEQEENRLKQLEYDFDLFKKKGIEDLFKSSGKEELESLKSQFIEWLLKNKITASWYNSKGFEHSVIQGQRHKFLRESCLAEEYNDFEAFQTLQTSL